MDRDEIEYFVFHLNHQNKQVQLYDGVLDLLEEQKLDSDLISIHPEFGAWMVELVPTSPYHLITRASLENLADSMVNRRKYLNEALTKYGLFMVSAASVPNLGVGDY